MDNRHFPAPAKLHFKGSDRTCRTLPAWIIGSASPLTLVCDGKPYVRWPVAPFPDLADDSFTELKDVEQFFAS